MDKFGCGTRRAAGCSKPWKKTQGSIFSVVPSPDGKILASDGYDPHIRLWALAEDDSGDLKLKPVKTLDGHTQRVWGLAFSPDGRTLASASWDMTVRFWDVESGKQDENIPLQVRLAGLARSPDGRYLAAPERGRAFWVWDVEQHRQRTTFHGKMGPVHALAFMPDSGSLFTANEGGGVQVWGMHSGQCIRDWLAFASTVHEVAWSPNGAELAGGGNEGMITIWDVARVFPCIRCAATRWLSGAFHGVPMGERLPAAARTAPSALGCGHRCMSPRLD